MTTKEGGNAVSLPGASFAHGRQVIGVISKFVKCVATLLVVSDFQIC